MMGFGLIGFVLVGVLIAVLIGWKPLGDQTLLGNPGRISESPLDLLNKRYAQGEISKQEYDLVKKDLE